VPQDIIPLGMKLDTIWASIMTVELAVLVVEVDTIMVTVTHKAASGLFWRTIVKLANAIIIRAILAQES